MKIKKNIDKILATYSDSTGVRWAILIATTAFFILIVYPTLFISQKNYELGDIATADIKAPRNFFVENSTATQTSREHAEKNVLAVYDYDTSLLNRITNRITSAFDLMQTIGKETEGQLSEASGANPSSTPLEKQLEDAYVKVQREFAQMLGLSVNSEAFRILMDANFDPVISSSLTEIVTELLTPGIVSNKDILLKEVGKGIVLRDVETKKETTVVDLDRFASLDQSRSMARQIATPKLNEAGYNLRNLIIDFTQELLEPNITLNTSATAERRKMAVNEVNPVLYQIKTGEMIVREGERVGPEQLLKLLALQSESHARELLVGGIGAAAVILVLIIALMTLPLFEKTMGRNNKHLLCFVTVFIVMLFVARVSPGIAQALSQHLTINNLLSRLSAGAPIAAGSMTICLLLGLEPAIAFAIIVAVAAAVIFENRLDMFIFFLISGMMAAYWMRDCRERKVFVIAGLKVGLLNIVLITIIGAYMQRIGGLSFVWDCLFAFSGGIVAGLICAGLVPLLETTFGYATDISFLELANLDRSILKRLMIEAPGTYHHSVVVGSLVEAAATEIGANSLLAKVCGYYHDIGKISKPLYFVENQPGSQNKHDKLAPAMSKRILISHVKDGVKIAKEHGLGQAISDVIVQHHGTSVIQYFYDKAQKQVKDTPVDMDEYRYPGPLPQTREAGLVMLADVVEASSRTLENPTPARIQGRVQELINKVFADGQLDNCELTLKDMHSIAKSFHKILTGIHHHRIEYPEKTKSSKTDKVETHDHPDQEPAKTFRDRPESVHPNGSRHLRRLGQR